MVQAPGTASAATELSRRLRRLRAEHWSDAAVTQKMLATALGVDVPNISTSTS
jgi:hypothetical protein